MAAGRALFGGGTAGLGAAAEELGEETVKVCRGVGTAALPWLRAQAPGAVHTQPAIWEPLGLPVPERSLSFRGRMEPGSSWES